MSGYQDVGDCLLERLVAFGHCDNGRSREAPRYVNIILESSTTGDGSINLDIRVYSPTGHRSGELQ